LQCPHGGKKPLCNRRGPRRLHLANRRGLVADGGCNIPEIRCENLQKFKIFCLNWSSYQFFNPNC
jgi:hypothetical protein